MVVGWWGGAPGRKGPQRAHTTHSPQPLEGLVINPRARHAGTAAPQQDVAGTRGKGGGRQAAVVELATAAVTG